MLQFINTTLKKHSGLPLMINPNSLAIVACYFIQKDHESNEWWREVIAVQVKDLTDQISKLKKEVQELRAQIGKPT